MLVDDRVAQSTSRTVYQNWQFGADRTVKTGDTYASIERVVGSHRFDRGNAATICWK